MKVTDLNMQILFSNKILSKYEAKVIIGVSFPDEGEGFRIDEKTGWFCLHDQTTKIKN